VKIYRAIALTGALALAGSVWHAPTAPRAVGRLGIGTGPFVAGSRIALRATGMPVPYDVRLVGPGTLAAGVYVAPNVTSPQRVALIAGNAAILAAASFLVVPAPARSRPLLAVASYDDGIVLHDPNGFARLAVLAIDGSPGDVAFGPRGIIQAPDTVGDGVAIASRTPWNVRIVNDVPSGNEIVVDGQSDAFVSNRDVNGAGALTKIAADGTVSRIVTGVTAEGLAIDRARGIVYVGNVNDATVLAVNARTMKPLRRIAAVPRVFGIALSTDGNTLYAVANRSLSSPFHQAGYVAAIALSATPHVVARSANLHFPLGIALDARDARLFVTDEASNQVYVLNAKTLRASHAPLDTCRTPWKPFYDAASQRVFVPCARADDVDVFDARTLARVGGAPFHTGGYPLAVAAWH